MNSLKQLAAMYGDDDDDNDEEEEASSSFSVEIDKRGIKRSREDENVLYTSEQDKSRYYSQKNTLRQVFYIFRCLYSSVFHSSSICFYQ